jgi:hypothetical protein
MRCVAACVLRVSLLVALGVSASRADNISIFVGTNIQTCTVTACPNGYDGGTEILPNQFPAQPFTLNSSSSKSEAVFVIINGPQVTGGSSAVSGLSFEMQLTNSIGPGTSSANVLAEEQFSYPKSTASSAFEFEFPVSQTLEPGTYYLVASTGSSSQTGVLAWANSSNFNQFGALGTAGAELGCNSADCSIDLPFPSGSSFIPVDLSSVGPPYEFRLCGNEACEKGATANVPEPPAPLLLGAGLLGLLATLRSRRRIKRTPPTGLAT